MKEIWEDIKGYEGKYQVSNLGRVKSIGRVTQRINGKRLPVKEKILKQCICSSGYLGVRIYDINNKPKTAMIHVLVWRAFGDGRINHRHLNIDHIDNDRFNNRIDNLQLLSIRENTIKSLNMKSKSSKYVGVHWDSWNKKWASAIWRDGKQRRIGRFRTEIEAYLAYKKELISQGDLSSFHRVA